MAEFFNCFICHNSLCKFGCENVVSIGYYIGDYVYRYNDEYCCSLCKKKEKFTYLDNGGIYNEVNLLEQ